MKDLEYKYDRLMDRCLERHFQVWFFLVNAAVHLVFVGVSTVPIAPIFTSSVFIVMAMYTATLANDEKIRRLADRLTRRPRGST